MSQTTAERDDNERTVPINTRSDDNQMTKIGDDHITNDDALDSDVDATITSDNANAELTDDEIYQQMSVPQFTAADYMADPFSKTIYNYLQNDMLTGDEQIDRKTLLLAEN